MISKFVTRKSGHTSLDVWFPPLATGCAFLPSTIHLSAWTTFSVLLILSWKIILTWKPRPATGPGILLGLAILAAVSVWIDYGTIFGRNAGTALAMLMVALKLLEANSRREHVFLYLTGYCMVFCSLLFSQSLFSAMLCIPSLILLTAGLLDLPENDTQPARHRILYATRLLLQASPFMLIGFLLFPRADFAKWNLPRDAAKALTGFTGTMSPGSVTELAKSDAVTFRAQFRGTPPPQASLYWRGRVLTLFDGVSWHGDDFSNELFRDDPVEAGDVTRYTVTLEPHNQPWLFVLDIPVGLPSMGLLTAERTLQALQPVQGVLTYEATSTLEYLPPGRLGTTARRRALQLPEDENPRSLAVAREWGKLVDSSQIVEHALDFYRKDFRYSLTPPPLQSFDSVDAFLFKTKNGFCEHFAGSFVFLMRAAGIPSRVVTGYQGGEIDPATGIITVRQAHAHAWAEIWMDDRGWVRIDPVTVLERQRVESGTPVPPQAAPASSRETGQPTAQRPEQTSDRLSAERSAPTMIAMQLGRIEHFWNRHVLSYRERDQSSLLQKMTGPRPSAMALLIWCCVFLVACTVAVALWLGRGAGGGADPSQKAWRRFQQKCSRAGCVPNASEGPYDFSRRCIERFPSQEETIRAIRDIYVTQRYGNSKDLSALSVLKAHVRRFRPHDG